MTLTYIFHSGFVLETEPTKKGYGFLLRQANKFERANVVREWMAES